MVFDMMRQISGHPLPRATGLSHASATRWSSRFKALAGALTAGRLLPVRWAPILVAAALLVGSLFAASNAAAISEPLLRVEAGDRSVALFWQRPLDIPNTRNVYLTYRWCYKVQGTAGNGTCDTFSTFVINGKETQDNLVAGQEYRISLQVRDPDTGVYSPNVIRTVTVKGTTRERPKTLNRSGGTTRFICSGIARRAAVI